MNHKISEDIITEFSTNNLFSDSIKLIKIIDKKKGIYKAYPENILPSLKKGYQTLGIEKLYSHQHESFRHINNNKNIVVVTPTASGKTMCYNLPILNELLQDVSSRALYLFPTKALSQDQQHELNSLAKVIPNMPKVFTYDGDTPRDIRNKAKTNGQIIISNPDMLHTGILPNHTRWEKFFENLKFIVIDELHTYRGVFGSHLAGVIARLLRLCKFYGSNPLFIASSATISNPKELAEKITGKIFSLVDQNGAPQGKKYFIFYNPPLVDEEQGIRRGVVKESSRIASFFIKHDVKTIIFARSRINVELITTYLQKKFPFRRDISAYRGGYLPNERRDIEKKVKSGNIKCIVSTNALELGIDIGGLDVSILAGYPSSVASTWQQSGRAGRKSTDSLSILVASSSLMDQFIINKQEYFFNRKNEKVLINPKNLFIHLDQIKCAAFELPFSKSENFISNIQEYLNYLEENGVLHNENEKYYWSSRSFPAESVSLRTASTGNFVIIDITNGKNQVIGEMDRESATELLYEEAIYLHRSKQYQVKKLDYEGRKAFVEGKNVNYYTDSISRYELEVLRTLDEKNKNLFSIFHLEVLIRRNTPKFKKIKFGTHENIGFGEIHLPEEEMHTTSFAIVFENNFFEELNDLKKEYTLSSIGYLITHLASLYIMCDIRDIGYFVEVKSPFFTKPTIYIYDKYPGGIGLSESILNKINLIIQNSIERIGNCSCLAGCPSCIGPVENDIQNVDNFKTLTKKYLQKISNLFIN